MPSIPVLLYHHVLPREDFISIGVDRFRAQMAWLARHGWRTLSAGEFLACQTGTRPPPPKAVLVTFDDGWVDTWLHAFPILREFGLRATVFLVTGWVEARSRGRPTVAVTWADHAAAMALARTPEAPSVLHLEQIEAMAASGLISFHSHTHAHASRVRTPGYDLEADLGASQAFFRRYLGGPSEQLCFPWGEYLPEDPDIARGQGFRLCHTTANGPNLGDGACLVHRFSVKNRSLGWFAMKLALFSRPLTARAYGTFKARKA